MSKLMEVFNKSPTVSDIDEKNVKCHSIEEYVDGTDGKDVEYIYGLDVYISEIEAIAKKSELVEK